MLLEEREEGEIKVIVVDGSEWLNQWFKKIREGRPYHPYDVDNERLAWMQCYQVLSHTWNPNFW